MGARNRRHRPIGLKELTDWRGVTSVYVTAFRTVTENELTVLQLALQLLLHRRNAEGESPICTL